MTDIMVDIETLSSRNDAAVISIGLAAFHAGGIVSKAGAAIDMKRVTGHIDPRTVKWWSEQDERARAYSFNGTLSPSDTAKWFAEFVQTHGDSDSLLWANSPCFDIVILRSWWREIYGDKGRPFPVHYRNERDCRTYFALARELHIDLSDCWDSIIAHNPVDDAVAQARAIITINKALKVWS